MLIKKYLSFDISKNNIGLAIGQNLTYTASPLKSITNYNNKKILITKIKKIILKWKPNKIIIGLPLNMDGSIQNSTKLVIKFNKLINNFFLIQTILYDERLTTYKAKQSFYNKKISIHSLSAVIILEDWLNKNKKYL